MMWRLIDPQHPMYDARHWRRSSATRSSASTRRCDDFVGEVMTRVPPGTPILIVSDQRVPSSFRQSVNLKHCWCRTGSWRFRAGRRAKKAQDLFGGGTFWENVDWNHTGRLRDGPRSDFT